LGSQDIVFDIERAANQWSSEVAERLKAAVC